MSGQEAAPPKSAVRRGVLLSILAALFAAGFLLPYRYAARHAPREAVVLAMLACAALLNGGVAVVRASRGRGRSSGSRRVVVTAVVVLAVLTIAGNIGSAGALARLGAGLTGTLMQTQVFLVALLGWLFLGERVGAGLLAGAAVAVGGFVVIAAPGLGAATVDPIGIAWAGLAAAGFGAMLVYTRAVIDRIDAVSVNALRLALAVAVLAAFPGRPSLALPWEVWAAAALAAALGPFASRLCLMAAVQHLSASRVKLITLSSPVFAFALEGAVLGAVPTRTEAIGAALILVGIVLAVAADTRRTR